MKNNKLKNFYLLTIFFYLGHLNFIGKTFFLSSSEKINLEEKKSNPIIENLEEQNDINAIEYFLSFKEKYSKKYPKFYKLLITVESIDDKNLNQQDCLSFKNYIENIKNNYDKYFSGPIMEEYTKWYEENNSSIVNVEKNIWTLKRKTNSNFIISDAMILQIKNINKSIKNKFGFDDFVYVNYKDQDMNPSIIRQLRLNQYKNKITSNSSENPIKTPIKKDQIKSSVNLTSAKLDLQTIREIRLEKFTPKKLSTIINKQEDIIDLQNFFLSFKEKYSEKYPNFYKILTMWYDVNIDNINQIEMQNLINFKEDLDIMAKEKSTSKKKIWGSKTQKEYELWFEEQQKEKQ